MKLLLDLDGIIFRCLCATSDMKADQKEWQKGYFRQLRACYNTVDRILDRWDHPEYLMALTGSNNFRKKIYSEYKANRVNTPRPQYLHDVRQYFIKYYGAVVAEGEEADDLLASNATEDTILCANDKDYLTVANTWIYNPWKDETFFVTEEDATKNFYVQCLVGDASDNIPGVPNPAKAHHSKPPNFTIDTATKLLTGLSKEEMRQKVVEQYQIVYGDTWFSKFDVNCSLLFLRRANTISYSDIY